MLSMKSVFAQSWGVEEEEEVVILLLFALSVDGDVTAGEEEMAGGDEVGAIVWGGGASGDRINVGGPENVE